MKICTVRDCGEKHYGKGLCHRHYMQAKKNGASKCSVEGCNRGHYARGYCSLHYERLCDRGNIGGVLPERERLGWYGTKTWQSWIAMRRRCENPNCPPYKHYGGRGIKVCERWRHFSAFLEDMGVMPEGSHIHRLDNDGPYEKGNCVWMARREHLQHHNPKGIQIAAESQRKRWLK